MKYRDTYRHLLRKHPFNLKGAMFKKKISSWHSRMFFLQQVVATFFSNKNNIFVRHKVLSEYIFCPCQRQTFFPSNLLTEKLSPAKPIAPTPHLQVKWMFAYTFFMFTTPCGWHLVLVGIQLLRLDDLASHACLLQHSRRTGCKFENQTQSNGLSFVVQ